MSLRVNQVVEFSGRRHRVTMVNDCRAVIVPVERKTVEIRPLVGEPVKFSRYEPGVNICPDSELPIVGKWDGKGVVTE